MSQNGNLPQIGVNIKKILIWNHHTVNIFIQLLFGPREPASCFGPLWLVPASAVVSEGDDSKVAHAFRRRSSRSSKERSGAMAADDQRQEGRIRS